MGFFEISSLAAAIFNTALALLVVRNNIKSILHRAYIGWALSLTTWNIAACFLYQQTDHDRALIWAKILQLGVIFMPVCLLHVCLILTDSPRGWACRALYYLHGFFAASLFTGYFVADVRLTGFGYWTVGGPLFHVFLIPYFISTCWLVIALNRRRKTAPLSHRRGMTALLAGVFCLWICGTNDLLPIIGMDLYPFTHLHFVPLGNLAANLYAVLVAYSVLQYELMDIHITMSKAAARLVRLSFVFVIALVFLLVAWMMMPRAFTSFSFISALVVVVLSTAIASVLFPRLFGSGEDPIERRILGDHFEYQDRIRTFISSVHDSGDAEHVLDGVRELLTKVIKVAGYQLIMLEETSRNFVLLQAHPRDDETNLAEARYWTPMLTYFKSTGAEHLASYNPNAKSRQNALESDARRALAEASGEFCFPIKVSVEPFGLLLLQRRLDGSRYTATDLHLLGMLVKSISLILNQVRLNTQILQAQESELLGRMSRGMAHDLNNLVTPIQTLMQLLAEGVPLDGLRDELLPVATRSIETMREYVREALFFSENSRPDVKLGRLDMVLSEAVQIVAGKCDQKQIHMELEAPGEALVEMDKSLIKRTVTNILSNAIDASFPGGKISVQLNSLGKSEQERDWFRICVIDYGEGIRPEDMQRIFTPYFTTKNRGDEQRGFGLGLSICRKVVQLHGGSLKISSQPRQGTTVLIDLPDHQLKPSIPATLAPIS